MKAQVLGRRTTEEAEAIANKYGKTLATIMAAAGLSTKATWSESVWNMHQVWYASAHCKQNGGMFPHLLKSRYILTWL